MSALDAALAAYAARDGRAYRLGNFRHRRLAADPIALVAFQLGGEPFAVAALAVGESRDRYDLTVPGQPLDRRLLFPALLPAARWFNSRFEMPWGMRVPVSVGKRNPRTELRAPYPPQVLVANPGTIRLLRLLGRRLAYLPTEAVAGGPPPADPDLVRFGRHLAFLSRHYREPGQQVIVDMTSLITACWITAQTVGERANLAAVDAWVEPPSGLDGFTAAASMESMAVGPIPSPDFERDIAEWSERLDQALRDKNPAAEASSRANLTALYRSIVEPAWYLLWRVRDREAGWPEEPTYTPGRVEDDTVAYSQHMAWMDGPAGGRRRTRESVRAAIRGRRHAENASTVVTAQEACSDPPLMIGYLLDHKAVEGTVDPFDFDHREIKPGNQRATSVLRLRLVTSRPCLMPPGKELWWTSEPGKVKAVVEEVRPAGAGSGVVLRVVAGATAADPLRTAATACFSILTTNTFGDWAPLPVADPFTHVPDHDGQTAGHLEPEGDSTASMGAGT